MADTVKQGGTAVKPNEPPVAPPENGDKGKAVTPPTPEKDGKPSAPDVGGAAKKTEPPTEDKGRGTEPPKDGKDKTPPPTVGVGEGKDRNTPVVPPVGDKDKAAIPPKDDKPEPPKKDGKDKTPPTVPPKDDKGGKVEPPKEKKKREPRPPDGSKSGRVIDFGGSVVGGDKAAPPEPPAVPEPPKEPPRSDVKEEIVQIPHAELFAFKDHPFGVRDDAAMKNLVESVKERGVDQPALVRPREGGGYEIVAGHRRQHASEQAGYSTVPCIVRNMTDEEAVLAMAETNFNQRDEILPSERAHALKMQLDAIKRQGARFKGVASGDIDKRSVEIIAERNSMNYKAVQRYIRLNKLAPELMAHVDSGKVKFIPAVEMSYIKRKNQQYIAMSIDGEVPVPSVAQAQRLRELDQKDMLSPDAIDAILLEEKRKGDIQVVLTSKELSKYFPDDMTPADMKTAILKALDENAAKNPPELVKTEGKSKDER